MLSKVNKSVEFLKFLTWFDRVATSEPWSVVFACFRVWPNAIPPLILVWIAALATSAKPLSYWFGSMHRQHPLNHDLIALEQMWFHIEQPINIEVLPKIFSCNIDVGVYMRHACQMAMYCNFIILVYTITVPNFTKYVISFVTYYLVSPISLLN